MASATILIKQLVQTYDAVQAVKTAMQTKVGCLIESQPYYKLIETEGEQHPYYALVAETHAIEAKFTHLVAAMLVWEVDDLPLLKQLYKLQMNFKPPVAAHAAISAIQPVPTNVVDCANLLRDLVNAIAVFRSRVTPARIKNLIQDHLGTKRVVGHVEVPTHSITKECNALYKEINALSKLLLDVEQRTTLREQLQFKQSMLGLDARGNAPTADSTIALLLEL